MSRLIVLDTETTGLDVNDGHRIIEIGCVEIVNRNITSNSFHRYVNPMRQIDDGAKNVHGITYSMLEDKPKFSEILNEFLEYLSDSDLIIHNAPFDLGFLSKELSFCGREDNYLESSRKIHDTLKISRKRFPGKRNSLDALCARYEIDNTDRNLHGALIDANLLASVYLKMTRGQTSLSMGTTIEEGEITQVENNSLNRPSIVIRANEDEVLKHENFFKN
tara:strand:- start:20 stop:679 length:660 start_codon:yes stop_codon:yes gene_type:complete